MNRTDASEPASAHTGNVDQSVAPDHPQRGHSPPLGAPRARWVRQLVWQTERTGILAAEAHGFRLVVLKRSECGKLARYMVLRRQFGRGSLLALVASGMEATVRGAMEAAEEQGCRFAGLAPDEFDGGAAE